MNKLRFIFLIAVFFLTGLLSPVTSLAQTESQNQQSRAEPSYEVVLQILIASNIGRNTTPAALSNVLRKLKTNYSFSDYRLAQTYVERTSFAVEHKGMLSDLSQSQSSTTPVFSEWKLVGLKSSPDAKGQNSIQFQNFSFGARIPVVVTSKGESDVSYESIGLNLTKFSLSENVPTVVGSLSTSKADELMFLVLTVRPAEE
ncbi:MAG TPA: hypothetical protein VGC76_15485 [Pyrinomonadaceae bacterium]|jgi:hypothetical protein